MGGALQMSKVRKRYSEEFRRIALERMKTAPNVVALARELGIRYNLLYKWRAKAGQPVEASELRKLSLEEENRQLKQLLAERELEVDFFKGALQKIAARRQASSGIGETASMPRSGK
jgi:transposase-like protein